MSFTVIIPARYHASRFPGKLLSRLGDASVLEHCWQSAIGSKAKRVIIAVDHQLLYQAALDFGAEICMTSADCPSGTDRVYQAATLSCCSASEVIVNLQGDEPLFSSEDINNLAHTLLDNRDKYPMASMMQPFLNKDDVTNPNMVKVVTDLAGRALYFSRSPIPYQRQANTNIQVFHHLGVYAYSMELLTRFVTWPVATLEACEQLEQLRALSNGVAIAMIESTHQNHRGIDTPEDLAFVAKQLGVNPYQENKNVLPTQY